MSDAFERSDMPQNWLPGRDGYATSYMPAEKEFLSETFERYPSLRRAFHACEKIYPQYREYEVRLRAAAIKRRIWADNGIPENARETLAEHTGQMAFLAHCHPQKKYSLDTAMKMISLWAMPLVIADEIPLDEMQRPDRHKLRGFAARMVFNDHAQRPALSLWEALDDNDRPESRWVNDLDYIATARKAREYQQAYPRLAPRLERLVESCRVSLLTKEAKDGWSAMVPQAVHAVSAYKVQNPSLTLLQDNRVVAFSSIPESLPSGPTPPH